MGEGNGSDEDMDAETDELLGDHGEKEDAQSEDEEGDYMPHRNHMSLID